MKNVAVLLAFVVATGAAFADENISYSTLRYTSFGVASPAKDRKVIEAFKALLASPPAGAASEKTDTPKAAGAVVSDQVYKAGENLDTNVEARHARIAELEAQLRQKPNSRAEVLRAATRASELERLQAIEVPGAERQPKIVAPKIDRAKVIVLVDTIPAGIELRDGQFNATDETVELLGRFTAVSIFREDEAAFIEELRALGAAAGGNVIVVSFAHLTEDQGQCHGGHGLVIRAPNFNEKKVTRAKLPSEI